MVLQISIAPPNSLILIADGEKFEVPKSMNRNLFAATNSCIAFGSLSEFDGKTRIILEQIGKLDRADLPVFVGSINTPSNMVAVKTTLGETLLEMSTPHKKTHVKIWANDKSEPDEIIIGIN